VSDKADVLILAGGFGTRMSARFPEIPKPLVPVLGTPILAKQIEECRRYGLTKLCLLLHYQADQIIDYFGDGSDFGVKITYAKEEVPLGTGGALLSVLELLSSTFVVLYADIYSEVDLSHLARVHHEGNAEVTLVAHPNSHPDDSDVLVLNNEGKVLEISPHPHDPKRRLRNMVNAAMYVFNKSCLVTNRFKGKKSDIAQDLLPELIVEGKTVHAYVTLEYLKDMGTPARLLKVESDIQNGIPKSRQRKQKRKSVFFDRDGTLNVEVGHLSSENLFELLPTASQAVARINRSSYLAVCTTNQPVIARGELSEEEHFRITCRLDSQLGEGGAYLDAYYFCPHHPDSGFDGEVSDLKKKCACRKPGPGMFTKSAFEHNIDLSLSWVVGDRTADIRAAQNIGARSVLVSTGAAGLDNQYPTRSSFYARDVDSAVDFILDQAPQIDDFMFQNLADLKPNSVVLISGLARTGKSILANNIRWYLNRAGFSAHILEMDVFLKTERSETTPALDRYDFGAVMECVDLFANGDMSMFHDRGFEHKSGNIHSYGYEAVGEKPILLVDGTYSAELRDKYNKNVVTIYVECEDSIREKRFQEKYYSRGLDTSKINSLWRRRGALEDTEIIKYRKNTNYIYQSLTIKNEH
jgi:D,D-heptose 1,7-bisphosphate phosphatase